MFSTTNHEICIKTTLRFHLTLVRTATIKAWEIGVGENVENESLRDLALLVVKWSGSCGVTWRFSKIKNRLLHDHTIPLLGI